MDKGDAAPAVRAWLSPGGGRLRVWSLIVTFLGDAVEPRGGVVPSARIGALTDTLGVNRTATRTALSRLVADGWAERLPDPSDGRASRHGLSAKGRAAFGPAARLVYAAPGAVTAGPWRAVRSSAPRGIPFAPGVGLWPDAFPPDDADDGLVLVGRIEGAANSALPIGPGADQVADARDLRGLVQWIETQAPRNPGLAMAARTVLVHRWRRHVLRYPEWPAALTDGAWPGHDLRKDVARCYATLWPVSERWLDASGRGYAALPTAAALHPARFGTAPA